MSDPTRTRRFERLALPHLDGAYNLARWLTRNDHDAEDVVQEAYLRAFKYFESFREGSFRTWLLSIVRNACYDWLRRNRPHEMVSGLDDSALEAHALRAANGVPVETPETALLRSADAILLNRMIADLPTPFREVLVMRELQDFSYREIADIAAIPVGTVMSRLARARKLLERAGARRSEKDD